MEKAFAFLNSVIAGLVIIWITLIIADLIGRLIIYIVWKKGRYKS